MIARRKAEGRAVELARLVIEKNFELELVAEFEVDDEPEGLGVAGLYFLIVPDDWYRRIKFLSPRGAPEPATTKRVRAEVAKLCRDFPVDVDSF